MVQDAGPEQAIQEALRALKARGDLRAGSKGLFEALGYESTTNLMLEWTVPDFYKELAKEKETKADELLKAEASTIHLISQFKERDIERNLSQRTLFTAEAGELDRSNHRSFLFAAVQLKKVTYPRGQIAKMTQAISKILSAAPVFVLFRHGDRITLAFAHVRPSMQPRQTGDVVGKVSLISGVATSDELHRGHLNILLELHLKRRWEWMQERGKRLNFDDLHEALLSELDVMELNRRFYADLYKWFQFAVDRGHAKYPNPVAPEQHVIRLITRMLFIWFLKEMGLVPRELFIEEQMKGMLKNCDPRGEDYYRAVLQNLFFATLNTEIGKRRFSSRGQRTHRVFDCYRYADRMTPEGKKALKEHFDKVPFINGGLFDCLDSLKSTGEKGYRVDCFTDNPTHRKQLSVPNYLFFDAAYGLIPLLEKYKFTVEENTPIEQEVALDPELLGRVFENLLAAYNPETSEKASERKNTGSFYTPRAVVDFMVDTAIVFWLGREVEPEDGDVPYFRDRLRYLLNYAAAYGDAEELFEDKEKSAIVKAIAEIKVLDPAVGSGAFLMGALNKLNLMLSRLDSTNAIWRKHTKILDQIPLAGTSEGNSGAWERKLALIQNNIFGLDIQPVACQIAKLRFFISLVIEQHPNRDAEANYGIQPLPNLESKFLAVDTLIKVDMDPAQEGLWEARAGVRDLLEEIRENSGQYFNARSRAAKLACRDKDERLRQALVRKLEESGVAEKDTPKIAKWDRYDQNAETHWFHPGYMLGVEDGFDVVIGNPPYVKYQNICKEKKDIYVRTYPDAVEWKSDLSMSFVARSLGLLKRHGVQVIITAKAWLDVEYGKKLQEYLLRNAHVHAIYHSELERQFATAAVDTVVTVISKPELLSAEDETHFINFEKEFAITEESGNSRTRIVSARIKTRRELQETRNVPGKYRMKWGGEYLRAPDIYHHIMEKHAEKFVKLGDVAHVRYGLKTTYNPFFHLSRKSPWYSRIEEEFLRPVIVSPKECKGVIVRPDSLPKRIFMCHESKESLKGTKALEYIEYGEEEQYHLKSGLRSRTRWWDLRRWKHARLLWPYGHGERLAVFWNIEHCIADYNMCEIHHDEDLLIWLFLRSSLQKMCREILGSSLGGGILLTRVVDTENFAILNPALMVDHRKAAFELLHNFDSDPIAAQEALDAIVFEIIGLTDSERQAVHEEAELLVQKRLRKAKNTPTQN